MNSKLKSILQFLIAVLIGGFFLYFVFHKTDWNDLSSKFRNTDYRWITLGLVITLFSHYLRAYRATLLYGPMGYNISVKNSFYAVIIGYMMNYIIPRAGEISRCATLVKTDEMPLSKSLGTVVTERVLDMLILMTLVIFIFIIQFDLIRNFIDTQFSQHSSEESKGFPLKYIILIFFLLMGIILYLLRNKLARTPFFLKLIVVLKDFKEGLYSVRNVKSPMLFLFLSLLIWLSYLMVMYFSLFAMESTSHLTFLNCLSVFAIGSIGVVLPAPAAGAGTYHFAVMESLMLFGVPQADGIAYATIIHGVQMILVLALGLVCSLLVMLQQKKNKFTKGSGV